MTTLVTPRLLLRPPQGGDEADLVRGLNNFSVSRWTARIPYPYGPEDAAAFLQQCAAEPPDTLHLAIIRQSRLIGVIAMGEGEIGYWLAEPEWGKGYGREAARAFTDHLFEGLGLASVAATYQLGNAASRRILLGLGFRELHQGKGFSHAWGAETDEMVLELTRRDWQEAKGRQR